MAKAKKHSSHQKHLTTSVSYIAVLSVVAIVVFLISSTQKNLQIKNQVEQKMQERTELISRGINPDPISIRQLPLDYRWNMAPFAYHARTAYLTPDIADFGSRRDDLKIGTENKFLVVAVDVAYTKAQGAKQDINVNKVVRVMANGKSYLPVSADTLKLGPNQNNTSYVIFSVPMTASEFSVTTGNKVTKLDFSASNVSSMQGVFTTTGGYSPEFN
jgi:hypothetical protein